VLQVGKTN